MKRQVFYATPFKCFVSVILWTLCSPAGQKTQAFMDRMSYIDNGSTSLSVLGK